KLVQKIEEEVLIPAEEDARKYVMNRLDRVGPADLDSYPGLSGYTHLYDVQEFFNNYYTEIWTYGDDSGRHEYTVLDYERHISEGTINEILKNYEVSSGS